MGFKPTPTLDRVTDRANKIYDVINDDPNVESYPISVLGIIRPIVQWNEDSPNWNGELSDGPVHNKWKVIG